MQPPAFDLEAEIAEEERRIRRLRRLVDFSLAFIAQSRLSLEEAQGVFEGVRRQAHILFPDKQGPFELIYSPRFRRLIAEKFTFVKMMGESNRPS